uniref:SUEL-type lectin domain-containing protein n=1 Tax=Sinocyclocheilus anshuiensis TaxID=1608454 RepID=A0A671S5W8_9TELE
MLIMLQHASHARNSLATTPDSDSGVISVQLATFGRTSSQICSVGRPPSETSNTKCLTSDSGIMGRILSICDGLRECEIGTQGLASKDPCFGTYKYYTTNYICIPAGIFLSFPPFPVHYTMQACKCTEIMCCWVKAKNCFNFSTCSTGQPASQLAKTDCYTLNSQTVVTSVCEGKNSCSILASNSVFSDPCVGTIKYLYISYSCVSPSK